MHNEPGYPMRGWIVPPISSYSETQALVKPDIEREVEAYKTSNMAVVEKPESQEVIKTESAASRKGSHKIAGRPKSESEVDRYLLRRLSTAQPLLQNGI
jgi:hypothetical protein